MCGVNSVQPRLPYCGRAWAESSSGPARVRVSPPPLSLSRACVAAQPKDVRCSGAAELLLRLAEHELRSAELH